jgi:hypothetical protein
MMPADYAFATYMGTGLYGVNVSLIFFKHVETF